MEVPNGKRRKYAHRVKRQRPVVTLEKPLSELAKLVELTTTVDIEAFVNRSTEERLKEVERCKTGRIKRPMNPFMLYRKAYQQVCKRWCADNTNQAISQVTGTSWSLETDSVKEQFHEWAQLETINHQNAFPGYKFCPRAHKWLEEAAEGSESEESGLDDHILDEAPAARPHKRQSIRIMKSTVNTRDGTTSSAKYPQPRKSFQKPRYKPYNETRGHIRDGYSNSSEIPFYNIYQQLSSGNPAPAPYFQSKEPIYPYYQQLISRTMPYPDIVEDIIIQRTSLQGMGHLNLQRGHALWLPEEVLIAADQSLEITTHAHLNPYLQQPSHSPNVYPPLSQTRLSPQAPSPELVIDPQLLAYDQGQYTTAQPNQESAYPLSPLEDNQPLSAAQSYEPMQTPVPTRTHRDLAFRGDDTINPNLLWMPVGRGTNTLGDNIEELFLFTDYMNANTRFT